MDLKAICHVFSLSKYGLKEALRTRIAQLLEHLFSTCQWKDLMELVFVIEWSNRGLQSAKDVFTTAKVPIRHRYSSLASTTTFIAYSQTAQVRMLGNRALDAAGSSSPYGQTRSATTAVGGGAIRPAPPNFNSPTNSANANTQPRHGAFHAGVPNRPPLVPMTSGSNVRGTPGGLQPKPASAFSSSAAAPKPVYDTDPKWLNSPFYSLKSPIGKHVVLPGFSTNPFKFWFEITDAHLELLQSTLPFHKQMNDFVNMDSVPDNFPNFVWSVYIMCLKGGTGIREQIPIDFPCKPKLSVDGKPAPKFVSRGFDGPSYVPCNVTLAMAADGNTISKKKFSVEVDFDIAPNNYVFYVYLARTYTLPAVHDLITSEMISHQSVSKVREMVFHKKDDDISTTQAVLGLKCPLLYTDIRVPARGYGCDHLQCFDLFNYLMLQQKSAIWTCPLCNANEPFFSTGIGQGNLVKYDEAANKLYFASQELGGVQVCDYTVEIIEGIRENHGGHFDDVQVVLSENGDWKIDAKTATSNEHDDSDEESLLMTNNSLKRRRESSGSVDFVELPSSPSFGSHRVSNVIDLTLSP